MTRSIGFLLLGIAPKTGIPQSVYREPSNLCWLRRESILAILFELQTLAVQIPDFAEVVGDLGVYESFRIAIES